MLHSPDRPGQVGELRRQKLPRSKWGHIGEQSQGELLYPGLGTEEKDRERQLGKQAAEWPQEPPLEETRSSGTQASWLVSKVGRVTKKLVRAFDVGT